MPTFRYIAVDRAGRRVSGELVEESVTGVVARLREAGRFPAQVQLAAESVPPKERKLRWAWLARISGGEMAIFSRQMANLVRGGLPIVAAFGALIEHTDNERLRRVLTAVRSEVEAGSTL